MKTFTGIFLLVLLISYSGYTQPSPDSIPGIWIGEYSGYDPQTQRDLTVRRRLIIERADSSYSDTLWGTPADNIEIVFETEIGKWSINLTRDSVVWSPTLSKRIDLSSHGTLVVYDHGIHFDLIDLDDKNEQWNFRDQNMGVDYTLKKDEILTKPSIPNGDTVPPLATVRTYIIHKVKSSLGHTIEYSFNWGDGTSSSWSTDTSAQHSWDTLGIMYVFATARCQIDTDKTITSDKLKVNVKSVIAIHTNNAYPIMLESQPNPFTLATIIDYQIQEPGKVNISIYNSKGQLAETLVNKNLNPGSYQVVWNSVSGRTINKGAYFILLRTENNLRVLKVIHL